MVGIGSVPIEAMRHGAFGNPTADDIGAICSLLAVDDQPVVDRRVCAHDDVVGANYLARCGRNPRWLAILVLYLAILGSIGLVLFLIFPPLVEQAQALWHKAPDMFDRAQAFLIDKGWLKEHLTIREAVERAPGGTGEDAVARVAGAIGNVAGGIFGVVTILIWQFIYDPYAGVLNSVLRAVGLGGLTQNWLGDPRIALYSVMGSAFPFIGGVAVLIYLAGLQSITTEIFDAAAIDGAHGMRRFFTIDLPLIMGQIKLNLVLAIIGGVQNFAGILILTNGGPAGATEVPGLYMYNVAFQYGKIGYASAIGVLIFLCIHVLTFLNMRYLRERV